MQWRTEEGVRGGLEPLPLAYDLRNKRVRKRQNMVFSTKNTQHFLGWGRGRQILPPVGGYPLPTYNPHRRLRQLPSHSRILGTPMHACHHHHHHPHHVTARLCGMPGPTFVQRPGTLHVPTPQPHRSVAWTVWRRMCRTTRFATRQPHHSTFRRVVQKKTSNFIYSAFHAPGTPNAHTSLKLTRQTAI